MAPYRDNFWTKLVLIRLIEKWKKVLNQKFITGTVLINLPTAFHCYPRDLLISKHYAYGFSQNPITFI